MEEYDTRRSTAVIISHEHTDIVYLSAEQILKSDPGVFDRQMVFNSVCKHERYCQISDLCWAEDWMFHIVQTVFDKSIMSVWSSAEVTGDRIPAGLTFSRGYDRKSIIRFCLWGYQIDRAVCRGKINWIAILKIHIGKIIAFVMNKYLMLFITYMMFNIQQCEVCHFCTTSGTKCNLKNNIFWRKCN